MTDINFYKVISDLHFRPISDIGQYFKRNHLTFSSGVQLYLTVAGVDQSVEPAADWLPGSNKVLRLKSHLFLLLAAVGQSTEPAANWSLPADYLPLLAFKS